VAESGLAPALPRWQRALVRGATTLTSPRLPDDYVQLVHPLWSSRELRGRVERVVHETADAATLTIRPHRGWPGHEPGQYLRIGVDVDGVRHWRAYSLTSAAGRADGCLSITVKHVTDGVVSPYLVRRARPGTIVTLGGVEGTFGLPADTRAPLLLLSAGSGITPLMAMLEALAELGGLGDVVHVHCAPTAADVIFGGRLRALGARHPGYRLHVRHTRAVGRLTPDDLEALVPDWRARETLLCGPAGMLAAMSGHWERAGLRTRLRVEHFTAHLEPAVAGLGGTLRLAGRGVETFCDGTTPMLTAAAEAGAELPSGCRMGICHTCACRLTSGRVRDLRTGEVHGEPGQFVRTCVNAAEGPVVLDV
jgi:ferredoxin-NADP reductase